MDKVVIQYYLKQAAWEAWSAAASAYRLYPDQKHTFSDYWANIGKAKSESQLESQSQQPEIPIEDIEVRKLLQEILDYNNGNGKYDFSHLPTDIRENDSFDAWQQIKIKIEAALQQKGNEHGKKQQAEWQDYLTVAADKGNNDNDGWISVDDRLPEIPPKFYDEDWKLIVEPLMVDVIVCEGEYVHQCSYSKLRGFDTATDIPVTHWQPLPAPPKK